MHQALTLLRTEQLRIAKFLRICSKNSLLKQGKQVHAFVVKSVLSSDMILCNDLVDMYGKCRRVDSAYKVFDVMLERNVVSWTTLICGFLHQGDAETALSVLREMGFSDVRPNEYTFSACFKACARLGIPEKGMQVHGLSLKVGFDKFPAVGNSLIDMYAKCGAVSRAAQVFEEMDDEKNVVAWNTIIAGYGYQGNGSVSIDFFGKMQKHRVIPDDYTLTSVLKACAIIRDISRGTQIHAALLTRGFSVSSHEALLGALIDLYVKCGCLTEARKLFDHVKDKSVVSWASLLLGYAHDDDLLEAMNVLRELRKSGIQVDSFTLSGLIGVFADFAFAEQGKQFHGYAIKVPMGLEVKVGNSIADLYLKCGLMEEAERIFHEMPVKNRISYTVMITGYGKHGMGKQGIVLFDKMLAENIRPEGITYLAILSACSHSGLIDECREYFSKMCCDRWINPQVEHYSCMVDLLGRAGRLKEAKSLIECMPMKPNAGVWQTLLSACRVHGDLDLGKEIGKIILELDGNNPVNYVIMSQIYANAGYWKECQQLRETVKKKGLKKEAGQSWVEIDKEVHYFYGGDDKHPLIEKIREKLSVLEKRLKEELGYSHEVRFSLHDVEEESKEENLRFHSEKLAIGLSLLCDGKENDSKVIRVFKNLRVCGDCHEFIKGLSKILEKVFLVRDANRFHKFQDGACSCGDYW